MSVIADGSSWHVPREKLALTEDEVHVWRVSLDAPPAAWTSLQQVLSSEEIQRSQKFYFEKDRRRWAVAHGVLRILLGSYLDADPTTLQFVSNAHGKPAVASGGISFNIAHSADLALFAFSATRQVGVDVEYMRVGIDYEEIARSFFSDYENEQLRALPSSLQAEAFYLCWSRKEAYIKARGKGLALPLSQFDVTLTPGEPALLVACREDDVAVHHWSLQALSPGAGYAGALAVEGEHWALSCWQWEHL